MIYVDGVLKNSQPLPSIDAVGVGDIVIGCRYTYDNYWWDGKFAGIMISNECKYNSNFAPRWPLVSSPTTMAYWSFDQQEGQTVQDDSGNNHNGVKANGEWVHQLENIEVPPPPSHYVLDLNSRNTSVTVPHSQELNFNGPFTLEAWVMARDFEYPGHQYSQSPINVIIDKRDDTGWGRVYGLSIQSGHPVCSVAPSNWSDVNVESSMTIELNRWYHIAGCYNGDFYSLFVDGVLQNTLSIPSTYIIGTGELVMGSRYSHDQYWWDGQFGGTMISNSCKYSGNFTPIWPLVQDESTVAYWDFNLSSGTTIIDASGHGHEGALSNGLLIPFQEGIPR